MKVLLSTFGPLHLIKSADALSRYVDIRVIQGWIPSWWNKWILSLASKLVGRNLFKAFEKRTPKTLDGRIYSVSLAEFYLQACTIFQLQSPMKSNYISSEIYGRLSKRFIKNADIFHVRSGSGFGGAIEKAKKKGMKVVVDHSIAHPAFMDRQLREEYKKNNTLFDLGLDNPFWTGIIDECKKGDIVLVNSQFVKETFLENGFENDKIKVVYLGVREDFLFLKKNYEIKNNVLKILFTGGFNFRKGAEYILLALSELRRIGIPYEFTCVGDFSQAEELFEKIGTNYIKRVSTVPQNELKSYLSGSDVYLFPSLCEGCASSGMEAMAAGLPVIATRESGLPINDGMDGILVQSKDVNAIVSALCMIYNNRLLRETLGQNAAKKIAKDFTWEQYSQNVLKEYTNLLSLCR